MALARRKQHRQKNERDAFDWRRSAFEHRLPAQSPLTADQEQAIHDASMDLLENVGLNVLCPDARRILLKAGAKAGSEETRIVFDRDMIAEKISHAPREFGLHARNPANSITIGGNNVCFFPATTPPNCSDRVRGRRPGSFADMSELLKLAQALPMAQGLMGFPVEPQDLPVATRHLDSNEAFIRLTDKIWRPYSLVPEAIADGLEMVAIARGISKETLSREPSLMINININSPLVLDEAMSDGLIQMAMMGQMIVVSSFTLAGAMAPVTIEGALVLQNAEVLAGICLAQAVRPGTQVVYGSFTSNVDMKSGSPALGTPETVRAALCSGQLARRYGLPFRSNNANSANCVDAQAALESQMSLWGAMLGGANVVMQGLGWLEGGLTTSYEKMILDAEMIAMMQAICAPYSTAPEDLAVGAITEVGPGGHFFGADHTLSRYRDAFYSPVLSDWRTHEDWSASGSVDAAARATRVWQSMLEHYEQPDLPADRSEALTGYVTRRKNGEQAVRMEGVFS